MSWFSIGAGFLVGLAAEQAATMPLRRRSSSKATPRPGSAKDIELPTSDGGVLRGVEAGSGPPVVLLHGITLRADVWHRQWDLIDEARVISIDLRGHGDSVSGRNGPTIDANAEDLRQLLDVLDLEGAVLAGHSMGGMVLGRFAADHLCDRDDGAPDRRMAKRVAGLGFISTAGCSPVGPANETLRRLTPMIQSQARSKPGLARRLASVPDNDLGQILVRATFGRRPDLRDVRETADAFESLAVDEFLRAAPSILDHDVLDDLRHCRIPAAVIVGSHDSLTPVRESRRLARALPDASLQVVEGAGHQLMLERPGEVNAMLRRLLSRADV